MNFLKTCSCLLFFLASTSFASTNNQDLKFTTLFEKGTDLKQNWMGNLPGYKVIDDTLVIQNRGGNIYTKKAYQDHPGSWSLPNRPHRIFHCWQSLDGKLDPTAHVRQNHAINLQVCCGYREMELAADCR